MSEESVLDRIASPDDLKPLGPAELNRLSAEIRELLVTTVAKTGGHLAPNLGVVELTVGLLRALDYADRPRDLGRRTPELRVQAPHRSPGPLPDAAAVRRRVRVPQALGERVRRLRHRPRVQLDLGRSRDGARARRRRALASRSWRSSATGRMTGGMAFEALNHAGHLGTKMIVLLNDNEMSISENVGALASYLARVRLDPRYMRLRDDVEGAIVARPGIGAGLVAAGEAAKESFKQLVVPGMLFEELGLEVRRPHQRPRRAEGPGRGRRGRRRSTAPS